LTVNNRLC